MAGTEMAAAYIQPFLKGETSRNTRGLLRLIVLCTIAGAAVASRLFSVISMYFSCIKAIPTNCSVVLNMF